MSDFVEPRDLIRLPESVVKVFASRQHRLLHAVWHGVRDFWESSDLNSENDHKRKRILELNWGPPRPALNWVKRNATPAITNGSGEDFLFMHREMIALFNLEMEKAGEDSDLAWINIPEPGISSETGYTVPPVWEIKGIPTLDRRFASLKSDTFFWSRMRWWDREFKNKAFLRTLTLGELGSLIETSVHNDMHIRWTSQPKDPKSGELLPLGRLEYDIDSKWDDPVYDFIGDTYSSHVNPVFWRLHKWVDNRIDDWYKAHEEIHKGEIVKKRINGIEWFETGRWVFADDPWSGPLEHHIHGAHDHHHNSISVMEEVMMLLFPKPDEDKRMFATSEMDVAVNNRIRNIIGAIL